MHKKMFMNTGIGHSSLLFTTSNSLLISMFEHNWNTDESSIKFPAGETLYLSDNEMTTEFTKLGKRAWVMPTATDYTKVKIAVRGTYSDAFIQNTLFAHGSMFKVTTSGFSKGILLLGASGSGKTTLLSALNNDNEKFFELLNDDWGPIQLDDKMMLSSGERNIHIKLESLFRLNRTFNVENAINIDYNCETPRAIVGKKFIFPNCIDTHIQIDLIILLTRNFNEKSGAYKLSPTEALKKLEKGYYSKYYNKNEAFCNGSLYLPNEVIRQKHRHLYKRLFTSSKIVQINNTSSQELFIKTFYDVMEAKQ